VPFMWGTRIAALAGNRFLLTWAERSSRAEGTEGNVYVAIRDSSGIEILPPTNLSNVPVGVGTAGCPGIGEISNGRVAVAFSSTTTSQIEVHVLDNDGNEVGASPLGTDGCSVVLVEIGEGRILAASIENGVAQFAILAPDLTVTVPSTPLLNASGGSRSQNLSVTTDARGNGILSWEENEQSDRIDYALVSPSGTILTPATIYWPDPVIGRVGFSSNGSAVTTYRPFVDVPVRMWAAGYIERLLDAGITKGCSLDPFNYCPDDPVTRAEMAAFLLRSTDGADYGPPPCSGAFADVQCPGYWAADYIGELFRRGITKGCALNPLRYCPEDQVTRAEMAAFLLRSIEGADYVPPPCSGVFADVPCPGQWAADYIEELFRRGITKGCALDPLKYCPDNQVTRAEMAAFLTRSFNVP